MLCIVLVKVFTVRHFATALYAVIMCLSVYPSQFGVVLSWLNVRSCKQCHTIAQGFLFVDAKDLGEILTGVPDRGRVGYAQQFSTNISETVQNRDIVIMED